jgi:hypothetical protein
MRPEGQVDEKNLRASAVLIPFLAATPLPFCHPEMLLGDYD